MLGNFLYFFFHHISISSVCFLFSHYLFLITLSSSSYRSSFSWSLNWKSVFIAVCYFHFFTLDWSEPCIFKGLDILHPHLVFGDIFIVLCDGVQLLTNWSHIFDFFMAKRPNWHSQQIVKVTILLVLVLFLIFGWLNLIEFLKPGIAPISKQINPLSLRLNHFKPSIHDFLNKSYLVV